MPRLRLPPPATPEVRGHLVGAAARRPPLIAGGNRGAQHHGSADGRAREVVIAGGPTAFSYCLPAGVEPAAALVLGVKTAAPEVPANAVQIELPIDPRSADRALARHTGERGFELDEPSRAGHTSPEVIDTLDNLQGR